MNRLLSALVSTDPFSIGSQKLGQPVPESNFRSEEKSSLPQPAQTSSSTLNGAAAADTVVKTQEREQNFPKQVIICGGFEWIET